MFSTLEVHLHQLVPPLCPQVAKIIELLQVYLFTLHVDSFLPHCAFWLNSCLLEFLKVAVLCVCRVRNVARTSCTSWWSFPASKPMTRSTASSIMKRYFSIFEDDYNKLYD